MAGLQSSHFRYEGEALAGTCAYIFTDGGGVRGYWTLLVLSRLMEFIAIREEQFDDPIHDQLPAYQSFDPQPYPAHCCHIPRTEDEKNRISQDIDHGDPLHEIRNLAEAKRFLPCHYFDYIGGTSTGGFVQLVLDTCLH